MIHDCMIEASHTTTQHGGQKNCGNKKTGTVFSTCVFPWQGQKDLNPRHAVLETAALPSELYPYEVIGVWWANRDSNPGPTGYEPVALTN